MMSSGSSGLAGVQTGGVAFKKCDHSLGRQGLTKRCTGTKSQDMLVSAAFIAECQSASFISAVAINTWN